VKAWKIQKVFGDLVYDLRNRGLLPVAALLVVAMVVVPILITSSAEKAPPPAPPGEEVSVPETETAVVAYNPGLRNYRERLSKLQSKDPFKQHFAGSTSAAAELGDTLSVTTGGSASLGSSGGGSGSTPTTSGGSGGSDQKTIVQTKYVTYDLNVAVGPAGSLRTRRAVQQLSFLPSESTPVLVFLGIAEGGGKAMFLVSSDVSAVSGEGSCMPSDSSPCEILVLRRGAVENLTYDPDGKVYRIKVLSIEKTVNSQ